MDEKVKKLTAALRGLLDIVEWMLPNIPKHTRTSEINRQLRRAREALKETKTPGQE